VSAHLCTTTTSSSSSSSKAAAAQVVVHRLRQESCEAACGRLRTSSTLLRTRILDPQRGNGAERTNLEVLVRVCE
jgi:hypothetical protein